MGPRRSDEDVYGSFVTKCAYFACKKGDRVVENELLLNECSSISIIDTRVAKYRVTYKSVINLILTARKIGRVCYLFLIRNIAILLRVWCNACRRNQMDNRMNVRISCRREKDFMLSNVKTNARARAATLGYFIINAHISCADVKGR